MSSMLRQASTHPRHEARQASAARCGFAKHVGEADEGG
jgi:hypothetical protein